MSSHHDPDTRTEHHSIRCRCVTGGFIRDPGAEPVFRLRLFAQQSRLGVIALLAPGEDVPVFSSEWRTTSSAGCVWTPIRRGWRKAVAPLISPPQLSTACRRWRPAPRGLSGSPLAILITGQAEAFLRCDLSRCCPSGAVLGNVLLFALLKKEPPQCQQEGQGPHEPSQQWLHHNRVPGRPILAAQEPATQTLQIEDGCGDGHHLDPSQAEQSGTPSGHDTDQRQNTQRHHQGGQLEVRQRQPAEAQRGRFPPQPIEQPELKMARHPAGALAQELGIRAAETFF